MRPESLGAAREWFAENRYQDYLYLHGLSVEMAEAFAEYLHKRIRGELGFALEEARDPDAMLAQGYRGSRYSFGYPACPNLADQRQLLALLRAEQIGITLSEEDQPDPEQSTSPSSSTTRRQNISRCETSEPDRIPGCCQIAPNGRQRWVRCDRPLLHLRQTARRSKESVNRFRLSYREEDPCDVVA